MANPEHLDILRQGANVWNRWRRDNPFTQPDLRGATFSEADLHWVYLRRASLIETDFRDASLNEANLTEADLRGANLRGASLIDTNLSDASLSKTDLSETKLRGASLRRASLCRTNLSDSDLTGADLSLANLEEANLIRASFDGADLSEADFSGASLIKAHLIGAILTEASFTAVTCSGTTFADVDLSSVKGLDTIQHLGPSSIGINTLYKSKGDIPEVFLRGCGIPDNFIEYMGSLVGKAWDYYSCFISYSSEDGDFAERLHADLQAKGVRCWFAPEDMKIGDRIRRSIDEAIRIHDKLLIILSEHSIDSDWVETEVETALEREAQKKSTVLFPVRLDDTVMDTSQPWAGKIRRERHIGDFRHWKDHDRYQATFDRLMRDLKAE